MTLLCFMRRCLPINIKTYNFAKFNLYQPHTPPKQLNILQMSTNLKPPHVKGMKVLDKTQFDKEITIPCVNLQDVKISSVLPHFKKYLLKMHNFKPIVTKNELTVIFLNPDMVQKWDDLGASVDDLAQLSIDESNLEFKKHKLIYENFSADDILKAILPADQEGMSSFTKVGHIVHVNLKEHLLPYKKVIGQVLLEKVSGCKSVVNKINMIDNAYRNFQMEVLDGVSDMLTKVKQNGCTFEFDFSTVYWNSRLGTEHERIVELIKSGDVLFDVFAGVGPFSIPVAKKRCYVYANDLNPESYKWLKHNAKINKINDSYLSTYNKDGHNFINEDLKCELLKHINKRNVHIVMNLPALALEFLSDLFALYTKYELEEVVNPPIVYVYCFAKGEDPIEITKNLLFKTTGRDISANVLDIFRVRDVSSFKQMMRVTIKLDSELMIVKDSTKRKCDSMDASIKKHCHGEEEAEKCV